tara:strand:+ start:2031 stop:3161 length:1131 start_codon:yes stop_codon:yes gene_type:complete
MKKLKSLYLHTPFCRKKCLYCDFLSAEYDRSLASAYIDTICFQIENLKEKFDTIYLGGGTPTVLEIPLLRKILSALEKRRARDCEFSLEANPESLTKSKVKLFLEKGVNRLSIGIQSLRDEKLKQLGRIHTAQQALKAIDISRGGGFKNISLDMIFGLWDESFGQWQKELERIVRLPITHISAYALTYEPGTPLSDKVVDKKIAPLDEGRVAKMFNFNISYLAKKGFKPYEVSNFAKNGFVCQHNYNYWLNNQYQALGVSAVSYLKGVRKRRINSVFEYIKLFKERKSNILETEELTPINRAKETAALKIRTIAGIDFDWFFQETGFDFLKLQGKYLEELREKGLIRDKKRNGSYKGILLSKKGLLHCDEVSSTFL